MSDFVFTNHGSLFLCAPQNDAARVHLEENVSEEAQWWAGALVVEPRYAADLAVNLQEEGFSVE